MSPQVYFRRIALVEAITWGLLLLGMVAKYLTRTTELGVQVFGMAHGIVFIAYCLSTLFVGIDQRWTRRELLLGLGSAVPPFATLWFERQMRRRHRLGLSWRLAREEPGGVADGLVAWAVRTPFAGVAVGVLALVALTGVALMLGPPIG